MSEHVTGWLGMYLDGELSPAQEASVQAHLNECADCRRELTELRALSQLVRIGVPFLPEEDATTFAASVLARLPEPPQRGRHPFFLVWRWTPLGLALGWAFSQALLLVAGAVLSAVTFFPLMDVVRLEVLPNGSLSIWFSWYEWITEMLSTSWIDLTAWGTVGFLGLVITVVCALLFASWFASWVVYHRQQQHLAIINE